MKNKNQFFPQTIPLPGVTLAEKLEEMDMGPKEFALRTNKPEKTITAILKGESSITPDMAIQFEAVTNIPGSFWSSIQMNYDEYLAREKRKTIISEAVGWASMFPIAAMEKKGWLTAENSSKDRAASLLLFFGFANHKVWEKYYFDQQLKASFKISLTKVKEPYAISAWLRKGELQAMTIKAEPYSEKKFRAAIIQLKSLMTNKVDSPFDQLQTICLMAGVKVVITPSLPKTSINGCARWLSDTPLIQLIDDYKKDDEFWLTFFHECAHILLHGKKDVFLEKVDYLDSDQDKEKQADDFAMKVIGNIM